MTHCLSLRLKNFVWLFQVITNQRTLTYQLVIVVGRLLLAASAPHCSIVICRIWLNYIKLVLINSYSL